MIGGRHYEFGVSGLLYKRNMLLFDRPTDSLWSQLLSEAVTGLLAGTRFTALPAENTTWGEWKKAHPDTRVLSFETGYSRDYKQDPYAEYPIPRNPALLVSAGGRIKVYPFSELKKARTLVTDEVGGVQVSIAFERRLKTVQVKSDNPAAVTSFVAFLDDLKSFYPKVEIYRAKRR